MLTTDTYRNAVWLLIWLAISTAGCSSVGKFSLPGLGSAESRRAGKPDSKEGADVHLALARGAEARGDVQHAIRAYSAALERDPELAEPYHRMALLHTKEGNCETARNLYREALSRAPDSSEIHCDLGYCCYLEGRHAEAEDSLLEALRIRPDFARARNNLAMLLARTGRFDEARRAFEQAGVSEADARANMAFALMMNGRVQAAHDELEAASRLGPDAERAQFSRLQELAHRVRPSDPAPATPLAAAVPAVRHLPPVYADGVLLEQ